MQENGQELLAGRRARSLAQRSGIKTQTTPRLEKITAEKSSLLLVKRYRSVAGDSFNVYDPEISINSPPHSA